MPDPILTIRMPKSTHVFNWYHYDMVSMLMSNGCSLGGWEEWMLPSPPRFYSCKWLVPLVELFVINVVIDELTIPWFSLNIRYWNFPWSSPLTNGEPHLKKQFIVKLFELTYMLLFVCLLTLWYIYSLNKVWLWCW